MRIAIVLAALAASAFPAAAATPAFTVTLKAPKATQFGHRIEFAGRLVPDRPGTLVQLFRGKTLVAYGKLRGDGTFRIPVKVASPGPFRVRAKGAWSKPLTVRIVPRLDAAVVGSRVVGGELRLLAHLEPAQAGALRVQVVRGDSRRSFKFGGSASLRLGTSAQGRFQVRVETVPKPGYAPVSRSLPVELVPPQLSY